MYHFHRVLGKWVDDVKMDEDGPLLKVIEPDPDGIPNLPMDDLERPSKLLGFACPCVDITCL